MIIEREALGGVCLNWGCIPTKALLRTSEIYTNMKHAAGFRPESGEDRVRHRCGGEALAPASANKLSGGVSAIL